MPAFAGQPGCEGFHPATVRGAEEGAPRPAHSNPRMFGGATQALGPLCFWPREECVSEQPEC
ncbi:hypothetical protein LEMLEM_LOCUS16897 [Lemmus lemmus]